MPHPLHQPIHYPLSRRGSLRWLGAAATSLAAGAMPARLAWAASAAHATENRLVVVLLRGALDGLAAVPALGDPAWADLRGHTDAQSPLAQPLHLDTTFAMHPALVHLHRWYMEKDLLVVHATASTYRERSHFDAQQLLESGGERPFVLQTGWLGRALESAPQSAMALTAAMPAGAEQDEATIYNSIMNRLRRVSRCLKHPRVSGHYVSPHNNTGDGRG